MADIPNVIVHVLLFVGLYFEVFLLMTFLDHTSVIRRQSVQSGKKLEYYPSVSIIVPCYNEEKTMVSTILSLLELDYPKDKLSILIVNDGSTDNSAHVLTRFWGHSQITVFHKENGGKYSALNFALQHVQSELVGCLDADSFVDHNALVEIVQYFTNTSVMAVTPAIKVHEPRNIIQHIQKAEYELGIFIRKTFAFLDGLLVTPGPFSIFRTTVFAELGGYREAYNTEDFEIALRMQSNHYKIENAHHAFVYTAAPPTFKKLFRQRLRWTYGFLKNATDYRHMYFKKQYGNLGMFILPITTLSIFSALYFTGMLLVSLFSLVATKVVEIQAVGFGLTGNFSFALFFINTRSMLFIIYTLVLLTLLLIIIGRRLSTERRLISFDLVYYLFLYGLMAPFWLVAAVYNAVLSRQTSWIEEKGIR